MARSVSLFSTTTITPKGLETVMTHIGATWDGFGWMLTRNDRTVWAELGTEDIPDMPSTIIDDATLALGGIPRSRVAVIFDDTREDLVELRMAKAVGIALAERCPIVWHDHADFYETLYAPGERPELN